MCDCIEMINEKLEEGGTNTRIVTPITFSSTNGIGPVRARVVTEKIEPSKRRGPLALQASYCPFCGEKYEGKT